LKVAHDLKQPNKKILINAAKRITMILFIWLPQFRSSNLGFSKILALSGSGKYMVIWGLPWGKRASMFKHEGCLVRLSLVNIGNGGYIWVWMPIP